MATHRWFRQGAVLTVVPQILLWCDPSLFFNVVLGSDQADDI